MNKIIRCVFKCNSIKSVYTSYQFSTGVVYRDNLKLSKVNPSYQTVSDFYAGKSVFITGATGFVGRVLIERLLHTCKDIENIYILIRAKNNYSLQQRLQELLCNPVFTELKKTNPQDIKKIVPVAGDVANVSLGLNLEDEHTLIEKVSVIFHAAANVKFRAPLSEVMQVNYEGTKNVLELAKKMKKLDVYVHTSTTFLNLNPPIEEIVHQPPSSIEDVYKVLACHGNEPDEIKKLFGPWGNCYTLSKHIAEAYVASNHGNIPTVIVRPSMVTSVYKAPLAGYTDSWVAGTGLLCDVASGLTRVVYGDRSIVVEVIPVDYVCNFLIVAAAKNDRSRKLNVFNISTGHSNSINWGKITDIYIEEGKKHGYVIIPFAKVYFTKIQWAMPVLVFLTQIVPAFTADVWLRFIGRKPRYLKLQKKAIARSDLSSSLTVSTRNIITTRARELLSTLDHEDRNTFPCDPVTIDWDEYIPIYCKGVKDYMLTSKNDKNK